MKSVYSRTQQESVRIPRVQGNGLEVEAAVEVDGGDDVSA